MYGKLYLMYPGQKEFDLNVRLPSVRLLDLKSAAPAVTTSWLTLEGSDGQRLQNTSFGANVVTASFFIKGQSMADFRLIKRELQSVFYGRSLIRLRSSYEPDRVYWVQATPSEILPIQASTQSLVDFVFTNPSGMAQSVLRSDETSKSMDQLGYGDNLSIDDPLDYTFDNSEFTVFNPSDVNIDPYIQHHDLKITIKGIGEKFTLKNESNGSSITINNAMKEDDIFILNGVLPYLNNSQEIKTDFGHIELTKGLNNMQLTGLTDINIIFSFPFLYF